MHTDRPWLTALEMQFAALRLSRSVMNDQTYASKTRTLCGVAAERLAEADTYAWARDPTSAVLVASQTMPAATRLGADLTPSASAWWWFDEPLPLPPAAGDPDTGARVHALLVTLTDRDPVVQKPGVSFIAFCLREDGCPAAWGAWVTEIDSAISSVDDMAIDAQSKGERQVAALAPVLTRLAAAGGAWLRQRLLVIGSGAIERHQRKQIAREYGVPLPSEVKVVSLRAVESDAPRDPHADPRDWSCRWVVRGHWRLQPYKDRRELRFIMPHVKGPADKPLRVPAQTVFSVHR